jgi:ribosome-associated toxin RatA of RatAB toxin-antitoxin module
MIVPITGSKYYTFSPLCMDEEILLVKEKDNAFDNNAIVAFNSLGQKFGYVSTRRDFSKKVNAKMKQNEFYGKVWGKTGGEILVELDFGN